MRMHAAEPAKSVGRNTSAAKIWHLDLLGRTDHHIFDLALSIQKNTDLTIGFAGDLRHLPGKLGRDYLIRCYPSSCEALDAFELIVFQPACKAVDVADRKTSAQQLYQN